MYGNMEKNFQNRIKINLLVRLEIVDGELVPVMPLFGFNLKLLKSEQFYLRGSISRNYHLPTLNDLYWYPGGNEALDPEKGTQIDGGLSFSMSFSKGFGITTDFGIFGSKIRDWIQWVPSDFRYWSPENIAQVYSRGIDISLHMNGTVKKFIYKVYGEYAYTKTTDISEQTDENNSDDDQLVYIPKNMANGFIYGSLSGYYLSWSINYIGKRNTTKKPLPAYCLNNISIGKKWYKTNVDVDIRFKVNNLFDVEYQAIQWRAMPGRNYELSIKLRLKK